MYSKDLIYIVNNNSSNKISRNLEYNNKLMSETKSKIAETLSKLDPMDWELIRFCNVLGTSVVGTASKLLSKFTLNNKGSIISYADKRRSNGGLYERLVFSLSHESGPNYWYYRDPMILESMIRYHKLKLEDQLDKFDDDLTETQNMYNNGYRKIYDCGYQVWKSNEKD